MWRWHNQKEIPTPKHGDHRMILSSVWHLLKIQNVTNVGSSIHIIKRKQAFYICENKDADSFAVTTKLVSAFVTFPYFQPLAIVCAYTARFVSDLFGNHIVGFLMTLLIFINVSLLLLFFFFNSVLRPFQNYFSSYETDQSVGGTKTGEPREKTPDTPASRTWLVSHVARAG